MRPGSHAETPTVAAVVLRAAAIWDPDGDDDLIADFVLAFEDRDEPVTALEQRDRLFFEAAGRVAGTQPAAGAEMAAAVATYLAFRRDEVARRGGGGRRPVGGRVSGMPRGRRRGGPPRPSL